MSDQPQQDPLLKPLVIVRVPQWFSKGNWTPAGAKALDWYMGAVEVDGEITIWRGIDAGQIDAERAMVKRHNDNLSAGIAGPVGSAPARPKARAGDASADLDIEAGRRSAALQRGGPHPLFRQGVQNVE